MSLAATQLATGEIVPEEPESERIEGRTPAYSSFSGSGPIGSR